MLIQVHIRLTYHQIYQKIYKIANNKHSELITDNFQILRSWKLWHNPTVQELEKLDKNLKELEAKNFEAFIELLI